MRFNLPDMCGTSSNKQAINLLDKVSCFYGLDTLTLQNIALHLTVNWIEKNHILYHEGQPSDAMYVIAQGRVKEYISDTDGHELTLPRIQHRYYFSIIDF